MDRGIHGQPLFQPLHESETITRYKRYDVEVSFLQLLFRKQGMADEVELLFHDFITPGDCVDKLCFERLHLVNHLLLRGVQRAAKDDLQQRLTRSIRRWAARWTPRSKR